MGYDVRDRYNVGEISVNHPNHLCVTVDLSATGWKEVGTHEVFTVSGIVKVYVWAIITGSAYLESVGNAGALEIGFEFFTNSLMTSQPLASDYGPGYFILPSSFGNIMSLPQSSTTFPQEWVLSGYDIGYNITTAAATQGQLEFHCIWQPLTVGATVVAGSGGSL